MLAERSAIIHTLAALPVGPSDPEWLALHWTRGKSQNNQFKHLCGLLTIRDTYSSSKASNLHSIRFIATPYLGELHIDGTDFNLVAINTTTWSILLFDSFVLVPRVRQVRDRHFSRKAVEQHLTSINVFRPGEENDAHSFTHYTTTTFNSFLLEISQ